MFCLNKIHFQVFGLMFLLFLIANPAKAQDIFIVQSGNVKFTSDAPLELIEAESSKLQGAIKTSDRSFVFRAPMNTF